ncbi:MAG: histidine ammonia-lyase [Lewinellaceae bacterium]|nr:histidine ammonia-lyase [Lewinellaceae bacterium]
MEDIFTISSQPVALDQVQKFLEVNAGLRLSDEVQQRVRHCREYLERKLESADRSFYGINTGFGSLCNVQISHRELEKLQVNLVQSHACGMGEEAPELIVRLMLLLKIKSLGFGYSGVNLSTVQRLVDFFNAGVLPVVFQLGSLGASGDLAPLAHLSLPMIGLGEVRYQGVKRPSGEVLSELGWSPISLGEKEGLALLNGTQFSAAYALHGILKARQLFEWATVCAALSLDAFDGLNEPFDARLHRIRPHQGQQVVAESVCRWLEGSEILKRPKEVVQDPYAFRCVPQVHGATWDAMQYVQKVVETEINGVTDNPNIFPDEDAILSGGNFHAQPLALTSDLLAIAMAELGNISERRTYQLISGQRGLPAFLTPDAGLNSGLMIPQYTAASMVSQNKQLCTPASVDSIVSSNGQEDHVSMAANAGTKLYRVLENVERLLAIEFMTAAQAMHFRRPLRTGDRLEALLEAYREMVPPLESDRVLSADMNATVAFFQQTKLK